MHSDLCSGLEDAIHADDTNRTGQPFIHWWPSHMTNNFHDALCVNLDNQHYLFHLRAIHIGQK